MTNNYKSGEVVLGNWKLVRLIGEGGFGRVFEAEREDFGTVYKAAIKIITIPHSQSEILGAQSEGMDEASVTAYFQSFVEEIVREFALMSRLKGTANVVSYEDHTVVRHEGEIGWDILIRMELLTPLLDYSTKRKFTRQDVIKLGIDICRALELCQKFNIIHRDIKSDNIFVSELGDYKLGDFGIARTVEKTTSGLSKKGTYTYMAPEIYRGDAYGSGVDLYSLGIVLYRMLNDNRAPFLPAYPAPISHTARENALTKRLSGEKLPNPKNADGRLAEIVLKACAYDPKDRYSSPMQMREELEAILYNREEAAIIYPKGDEAPIKSADYIETKTSSSEATESVFGATVNKTERIFEPGLEPERIESPVPSKRKKFLLLAGIAAGVLAMALLLMFVLPAIFGLSEELPTAETPVLSYDSDLQGVDPYELYSEILALYQELVDHNFFRDMSASYLDQWVLETNPNVFLRMDIGAYHNDQHWGPLNVYYAFFDVDDNGIPELFIISSRGILNVFTWHAGHVYELFEGWDVGERINITVRNNGILSMFGTDGWNMYGYSFYQISQEGNSVILVERVSRADFGDTFYRGDWDEQEEISEREFEDIVRGYTGRAPNSRSEGIALEWRRFVAASASAGADHEMMAAADLADHIDIWDLFGSDFNEIQHLFGAVTASERIDSWWGQEDEMSWYEFDSGLSVTIDEFRGIVGIEIDYQRTNNRDQYHLLGIDGTFTSIQVISVLGQPSYVFEDGIFHFSLPESIVGMGHFGAGVTIHFDDTSRVSSMFLHTTL